MIFVYAVVGIIKRESKVLVGQRPEGKPYSGFWEFPGGKVEENECGRNALSRELDEELGIEVISSQHLFNHRYSYPDKIVQLEIWQVTQFSGEAHSKENQILRWVTWPEMLELPLLEGNWSIVDKIRQMC
ncbi:MAG: NUDIX domain-containing protein [Gammaproteobacteria bacterium]|nr:NUDIX domain-containing protein [Gammaproteobacteria bacterium]MCW5582691.1 NUDIX domain-containing protein [Gammaproteobacteria bacterium]